MNEAPPAPAQASKDFGPRFDALPVDGPTIMTIVAFDFLPKTEFKDPKTQAVTIADGLRFYFGTVIDGKPYFLSPWPMRYSINEKSGYTRLFTAATGAPPQAGSTPKVLLGKGVTLTINNVQKVSKKGVAYTASKITATAPVHKKLLGEVVPLAELEPALKAAFEANAKDGDVPF